MRKTVKIRHTVMRHYTRINGKKREDFCLYVGRLPEVLQLVVAGGAPLPK